MRLFFILLSVCLFSCSSKNEQAASSTNETSTIEALPKGQALIESSDCQTCHHTKNNLVGPSYTAIANKYENNTETVTYLVSKIKVGGGGVWGDSQMLAHPALSDEDAKEMVDYIMSFKTKE